MPASQFTHDIAAPALVIVAFSTSFISWAVAIGDELAGFPYPVLIGSLSTVGMTLIVLYGKFREIKLERDRQERIAFSDQKNDKLVQLIRKLCERIRRHEQKIRRLEARIQDAEGTHTKSKNADQDIVSLIPKIDNTSG